MRLYHFFMSGVVLIAPLSSSAETMGEVSSPDVKPLLLADNKLQPTNSLSLHASFYTVRVPVSLPTFAVVPSLMTGTS